MQGPWEGCEGGGGRLGLLLQKVSWHRGGPMVRAARNEPWTLHRKCWASRPLQSRRLNSKPLAKIRITRALSSPSPPPLSHCNAPSPTLSNLAYSFLPPTRKGMGLTRHPTPIGALYQPTHKCILRPLFPQPIRRSVGYHETSPLPEP